MGRDGKIIGKALFVYKQNDESMDPRIMTIMDHMIEELDRRGIVVTKDELESDCNLVIMFVTKDFLYHRYDDIKELLYRFTTYHCCVIICDDKEHKFARFINYSVYDSYHSSDKKDLEYLIDGYEMNVHDVTCALDLLVVSTKLKCPPIIPGLSPPDDGMQNFAIKFAEDAVQIFNPAGLDYGTIDTALESDITGIYQNLVLRSKIILHGGGFDDDSLLAVFAGCQCLCFDISIILKLVRNLDFLDPFEFKYNIVVIKKEYINDCYTSDDPNALQYALLRTMYPRQSDIERALSYHLSFYKGLRHLVLLEDFNFSKYDHALLMLSNLTSLIGKGSLVILSTSSSCHLFHTNMDFVANVSGTGCGKDTNSMVRCYAITKSKLPETIKEVEKALSQDDKKHIVRGDDLAQFESSVKKLKTTSC